MFSAFSEIVDWLDFKRDNIGNAFFNYSSNNISASTYKIELTLWLKRRKFVPQEAFR